MVAPVFGGSLSAVDAAKVARLLAERDVLLTKQRTACVDYRSRQAIGLRVEIADLEDQVERIRTSALPGPCHWLKPPYGATCLDRAPDWWTIVRGGAV